MKTTLSALALFFATTAASAHPGHSHADTPGGEQHHLIWLAIAVVGVSVGVVAYKQIRAKQNSRSDNA